MFDVSIPEMVRLIANAVAKLKAFYRSFNSRDGAIDSGPGRELAECLSVSIPEMVRLIAATR